MGRYAARFKVLFTIMIFFLLLNTCTFSGAAKNLGFDGEVKNAGTTEAISQKVGYYITYDNISRVDWFYIDVDVKGRMNIALTPVIGDLNLDCLVYSRTGDVQKSWNAAGKDEKGFLIPQSGRYYLKVFSPDWTGEFGAEVENSEKLPEGKDAAGSLNKYCGEVSPVPMYKLKVAIVP